MSDDDQVGFVFMTDPQIKDEKKTVYFHHGNQKVPVQKGTLVSFPGTVHHHTELPDGQSFFQLLGPFALTASSPELIPVAVATPMEPSPEPSPAPSTECDECLDAKFGDKTFYKMKKTEGMPFGLCFDKCFPAGWMEFLEKVGFECGSCDDD